MGDDEDFTPLAKPRTTRWEPKVVVLRKPRSEDMRVVVDAEIRALPNNVLLLDAMRGVIRFP